MLTADQIRDILKLEPLPIEGGYFVQTYASSLRFPPPPLPSTYSGDRALATAIYYLLTPDTFSALHKLHSDEIYHFYLGDPVEILQLGPDGTGEVFLLGQDIAAAMRPQHTVPGGIWQGSRLRAGGSFALLGTTMCPGFDLRDYQAGSREELTALYPAHSDWIVALTR